MRKIQVNPGSKFAKLTVVSEVHGANRITFNCICDCGKPTQVDSFYLRTGHTKSCGCLVKETVSRVSLLHGYARKGKKTKEYGIWCTMISRCHNPNSVGYKDYGGRGIFVCNRWRNSFIHFFQDMGTKPDGLSLERKNNDAGYSPDNCKWATPKEQANNRRKRSK